MEICTVEECENPAEKVGRTLCRRHYRFKRVYGDVNYVAQTRYREPEETRTEKKCRLCKQTLAISMFGSRGPKNNNRTKNECKSCINQVLRLRKYGVTSEWFAAELEKNAGKCPICLRECTAFVVDHDHSCCSVGNKYCGKCARGLLCYGCNSMLGQSNDDPEILSRAIQYLEDRKE